MNEKISESIVRVDAHTKIGGQTKYVGDMKFDGMLYAKTVRSLHPRAKILSIDIPDIPDGYFIVDKNDVPGKNRVKILIYDQPFFAEGAVNYIGEPILLVVGPDRDIISQIISQIDIEYEPLPAVLTIEDALLENSPRIYGQDNCFVSHEYIKGEPDDAFANADKIIDGEYRTGYQEQLYIEPQGVIGIYENHRMTIYGSMQCPYYAHRAIAEGLGWSEDKVRVIQTTTGGAFGGKEEYPSLLSGQVAFASLKTKKPVKLVFDRDEDIQTTTKRHPSVIHHRTALDSNGTIIAADIDIKFDAGAYAGLSDVVLQRGMFCASGVYNIPNLRVRGRAVATNTVPNGAFRGFGAPQAFFAMDMQIEKIARIIGINSLDFRLKHALKKGDRTCTDGLLRHDVKIPEMMSRIEELSDIRDKIKKFKSQTGRIRKGIGLSMFYHGCGFTGNGEEIIHGTATLRKYPDSKVEILTSNVEMGQGALTAMRKIVAKSLEIPIEDVIYENPDTSRVPDSGPTVASRTTVIVGGLLKSAADELKQRWNEPGEIEVSKTYHHPKYIEWNQETMHGDAYPTYSWGINVVEVEVDTLTYEITPKKVWAIFDVGVPIDERMMRGQIEGGIVQGLGYGSIEVMENIGGKIQQGTITDYTIPTAKDVPEIVSEMLDNPYEYGPFGAKCSGELTLIGAAPALAAAVENALEIEINKIPVRPEELLEKMEL
ncbi:xanthine dehydrogenase family protein [bacterium]|nr:xanthine dehydrogenase family protein [bacterium]